MARVQPNMLADAEESEVIAPERRHREMEHGAAPALPEALARVAAEAASCRRCPLWAMVAFPVMSGLPVISSCYQLDGVRLEALAST